MDKEDFFFIQKHPAESPKPVFVLVPPNGEGSASPHQGETCQQGVDPSRKSSGASSSASLRVKWKLRDTKSSHRYARDVIIISKVFTTVARA